MKNYFLSFRSCLLGQNRNRPESVALQIREDQGYRRLTYRDLYNQALSISRSLENIGLKTGEKVALCMPNMPEWAACFFGCQILGVVVVPLDYKLTATEQAYVLADSGARLICSTAELLREGLGEARAAVGVEHLIVVEGKLGADPHALHLDDLDIPDAAPVFSDDEEPSDRLAVLAYTSGTTGRFKGVELTEKNIVSNLCSVLEVLHFDESDNILSILPLCHMFEIICGCMVPLYIGGKSTYIRNLKPKEMLAAMRETGVTTMMCVPLLLKMFYDGMRKEIRRKGPLKRNFFKIGYHLSGYSRKIGLNLGRVIFKEVKNAFGDKFRFFVCGAAPLSPELYEAFECLGIGVVQGYGLTENSLVVTANPIGKNRLGSIGKPIPDMEVAFDPPDAYKNKPGEILIRGPSVMQGYHNSPEDTEQALRDGWLHTGDLGYMDKDGYIFLLGRSKNVIIGGVGKNIYPEEVEEVLMRSPFIKELCVLGRTSKRDSRSGDEQVFAVILPDQDYFAEAGEKDIDRVIKEEIRRCCSSLADYKRVKDYVIIDEELPKTTTRKVKRKEVLKWLEDRGL